jgi:deazaflavin-dependent oxidoreductase (nitroreductase family)
MADWDPEAFTRGLIADMRANGGQVTGGPMAGRSLLILTTTGAKTGEPRTAIATFTRDGEAYVIAGTKSGAPVHPAWYTNLVANPEVTFEANGKPPVKARAVPAEGADRDALWDRHVEANPYFAEYPAKTEGRLIPMIRITPEA